MDILPLQPAQPRPLELRIAVGGNARESFDVLLRAPRDRLELDDLEAARPSEPDNTAPPDRGEPDDLEASRPSEPDTPAPNDGAEGQTPDADSLDPDGAPATATEHPGHREQPGPEVRSDHARRPETGMRDGAALDMRRAGIVQAARTSLAGTQGHTTPDQMSNRSGHNNVPLQQVPMAPSSIEALKPRSTQASEPLVQVPKVRSSIEALEPRRTQASNLLVQVTSERSAMTTSPQRALGGQTALAAQTIAAELMERPPEPRNARSGSETAIRVHPTEVAKTGASAPTSVTARSAEPKQASRSPASSAAGTTLAGLPDRAANTGAGLASDVGARTLGSQGLPVPALGQPTPLVTGHAAQAVRPAAGPQAPADQVAVQVRNAVNAGQDRINIRLYPAELGRIDVKMEWADDGVLRAAVSVERSETLDLLQRDSRALHRALQEAGLKTDSGSLSFDLRGHAEGHATPREPGDDRFGRPDAQPQEQGAAETGASPAERHRTHDGILDLSV